MEFLVENGGNPGMTRTDDVDAGTDLRICASSDSCILCDDFSPPGGRCAAPTNRRGEVVWVSK